MLYKNTYSCVYEFFFVWFNVTYDALNAWTILLLSLSLNQKSEKLKLKLSQLFGGVKREEKKGLFI